MPKYSSSFGIGQSRRRNFFASLLMGVLAGQIFAGGVTAVVPALHFDPNASAIIAMSALSASVIGGPLTVIFIALELTGDLWLTVAVLVAVIISAQVTRELFGYSFATWRFHLRSETIGSAADVGWVRDLTVGRMMRRDVQTISADATVSEFRQAYPGSTGQLVAIDTEGRYVGLVIVAETHTPDLPNPASIRDLLWQADEMLSPTMTVQQAVAVFDRTECEALAVVDSFSSRKVIGLLTEAYTLRRFSAQLELRRRELLGEIQPTASAQPDHEPFARFRGRRTGGDLAPRRSLMRERLSERSERLVG